MDEIKNNKGQSIITKRNNENSIPIEPTTSERKGLNILIKNSYDNDDNDNNDASMDIKTSYAEENINIKKKYSFNCHSNFINGGLSNSKEVQKTEKDRNSNNNDKDKTPNGLNKEYKNIDINGITPLMEVEREEDNPIFNTINYDEDYANSSSDKNSISFKDIITLKDLEFKKKYRELHKNEIFRAKVIYQSKECIFLLIKEFLYILEFKPKLKEEEKEVNRMLNPDLSLINQLRKEEFLNHINKNILKHDYDLSCPLVCLNLNLLTCKMLLDNNTKNKRTKNKQYEIQILILGTSTKFSFFFQNSEIYQKAIYILGPKIVYSQGNDLNKLGLSLREKDFYRDTYISNEEFEAITKTGDLLLFRTMDCISDCQRVFTRDKYDHIVLIIKRQGVIELLEATSNDNISLLDWKQFKYRFYNLVFKKIVLRRLNIEEDDPVKLKKTEEGIAKKTNEFIDKILKKKYIMSVLKMAFDRKPKEYEIKGEWEKGKGYCCSALTGAFYIYNGIMKLEKSVHCIRPGDFEQDRNKITFLPGFSLGPEKIIEFSS